MSSNSSSSSSSNNNNTINNHRVNPILKKDPHFQNSTTVISDGTSGCGGSSSGGGGGVRDVEGEGKASFTAATAAGGGGGSTSPPCSTHHLEESDPDNSNYKSNTTPGKEKKHLKWDEHAIEEHDLLRGTRMKIDEPNTPYTHYEHDSDVESNASGHHPRSPDESHPINSSCNNPNLANNWNDIASKLQAVADRRNDAVSPAPSWQSSNFSDSEDEAARIRRRKESDEFICMRKKHYNEAEAMKRWRAEHVNDDDDDDDDDGDEMVIGQDET